MRSRRRWPLVVFWALVLVAVLAPILANDRPITARVGGDLRWPAVASYWGGGTGLGPAGKTWKSWWYEMDGADAPQPDGWAVMPFIPHGPFEANMTRVLDGPTLGLHYMGNDNAGRDVLARLIHGTSTALLVGLGAAFLALCIGMPLGFLAGLRGGWTDTLVLRLIEVVMCFPSFFLVLSALAFLGSSTLGIVVVLGVLSWPSFARIVRGELLSLREREFVVVATGLGVSRLGLARRHLLPVIKSQILVNASFVAALAIVVESTLRYVGIGASPDSVSWGSVLQQGRQHAHNGAWHLWLFPSLAVILTVSCFHGLADRARRQ